jgi:chromosome segregation ATPase
MLARKPHAFVITAALGTSLFSPFAIAETVRSQPRTEVQAQIAERLDSFESTAANLRNVADHYAASVRSSNLHIQSYRNGLNQVKERVNTLGGELNKLEALKSQGTHLQQLAISEARPHLEAVADHVQTAIVMLNEDQRSYRFQGFRETVKEMQEHADNLYTQVDAITDYEKTRIANPPALTGTESL